MSKTCTKCKQEISDNQELESQAEKYPICPKCWDEWKEMKIMVINEMHLDLSLSDHRKVLRKHEKIFAGVMTPEGDYVDFTNEDNRNPEEKPCLKIKKYSGRIWYQQNHLSFLILHPICQKLVFIE